jgi:hypothetical protein
MKRNIKFSNLIGFAMLAAGTSLASGSDFVAGNSDPSTNEFDQLWSKSGPQSASIRAAAATESAAGSKAARLSRHWFPKLSLQSQLVSTNDPTTTLFSTLGSRSLEAADLNPATINQPAREWFARGGLNLDWAIFEGGARTQAQQGANLELEAQTLQLAIQKDAEYAMWVQQYARGLSVERELKQLLDVKSRLAQSLKTYRLGSKENPVGYSGLLGLKALMNRVEALEAQLQADASQVTHWFRSKTNLSTLNLKYEGAPKKFIEHRLGQAAKAGEARTSQSAQKMAEAYSQYAEAEKARWLPKVGLFAQGNLVNGPRNLGTALEAGAYLQWELFNPTQIGVLSESRALASAAEARAAGQSEEARVRQQSLVEVLPVLSANLDRTQDSMALTSEQTQVTDRLFRSGSINALQFVEVLSRRVDLIEAQKQLEFAYAEASKGLFVENGNQKN